MSQKTKNIILVIVAVILIFIAYSLFIKPEKDGGTLVSEKSVSVSGESVVVQEFLSLLQTLNNLRLDTTIFNDPVFKSLRDESVELTNQPRGRVNPFAPLQ